MKKLKVVLWSCLGLGAVQGLGAGQDAMPVAHTLARNEAPLNKVYVLTRSVAISDAKVQAILLARGLDLEGLWEKQLALQLTAADEAELAGACEANDQSLVSADLRAKVQAGLAAISAAIANVPDEPNSLLKAVGAYFTEQSFWGRVDQGDETILDRPSTPFVVHTFLDGASEFSTYAAFADAAQSSETFKQAEGERYTPTETAPFVNPTLAKTVCHYLMLSSSCIGIPLLRKTVFQDTFYPEGYLPRQALPAPSKDDPNAKALVAAGLTFPNEIKDHKALTRFLTPFDYSHRSYQGHENQGNHGTCWLFAAKRLAEEQVCHNQTASEPCNARLSTYDLSRNHWTYLTESEGGWPINAMRTAIRGGVCSNDKAPYLTNDDEDTLNRALTKFAVYTFENPDVCSWTDAWNKVAISGNHTVEVAPELLGIIEGFQTQLRGDGRNVGMEISGNYTWVAHEAGERVLGSSIRETRNMLARFDHKTDAAIRDTLVGRSCRANRISAPFEGLDVIERRFDETSSVEERLLQTMQLHNETGNSIGLYLCARSYMGGSTCGNHAIEMDGIRFNESTKQWEGHFVNSWGPTKTLNDWIKIDRVFRYVYGILAYKANAEEALVSASN